MRNMEDELYRILKEIYKNRKSDFVPGETKIKVGEAVIDHEEAYAVIKSVLNGWFGLGGIASEFENEFANILNTKFSALTNSGSSSNLLAIATLAKIKKLQAGSEVIVSSLTFPTTFTALMRYGLKPVVIDVDNSTYNFNLETLKDSVTDKTKVIIAQHTMGIPNDMDVLTELSEDNNISLIEDSCEALGSRFDGKLVGSFGIFGTFSFYVPHHITLGEGGAVVSNDMESIATIRSLRDGGVSTWCPVCNRFLDTRKCPHDLNTISKNLPEDYHRNFVFTNLGYKMRPLELQAALGLAQLKKLHEFNKIRKHNTKKLYDGLSELDSFVIPTIHSKADPVFFALPLTISDRAGFNRKDLITYLDSRNIEVRPLLAGNIVRQPIAKEIDLKVYGSLANSDKILNNGFYIGNHPAMNDEQIDYVIDSFEKFIKSR